MNFNKHLDLEGKHAIFGASQYHWINYTPEKLDLVYSSLKAKEKGTELHDFAKRCIELGVKLPKQKKTLNMYVNDAIGYKMTPEQPLYFSENFFGTADTICFRNDFLRIHDYKSGVTTASMHQLEIYMALFCLEYKMDPFSIGNELRIYQNNEVLVEEADANFIKDLMNKIIFFDKRIQERNARDIV